MTVRIQHFLSITLTRIKLARGLRFSPQRTERTVFSFALFIRTIGDAMRINGGRNRDKVALGTFVGHFSLFGMHFRSLIGYLH